MSERKILGICAWLADKFGLDVGGVRILFVAAIVLGLGSPILVYFILVCMLVKVNEEPIITKQLDATICWMDKEPLQVSQKYYIQHGVNDAQAKITQLSSIIKTDFSGKINNPSALELNQIGDIQLKLSKPLLVDAYHQNKSNGSFILINPKTNNTVGVGFIR